MLKSDMHDMSLQGWMYKRGLQNPAFRRRWFVLQEGTVTYYKERAKPKSKPKGSFSLRGAAVYPMPDSEHGRAGFWSERRTATTNMFANQGHQPHTDMPRPCAVCSRAAGSHVQDRSGDGLGA